jgi:hypothetical protein
VPGDGQESDDHSEDEVSNLRETLLKQSRAKANQELQLERDDQLDHDSKADDADRREEQQDVIHLSDDEAHKQKQEQRSNGDSPPLSPESFHRSLLDMPQDQVRIPDAPETQQCSQQLIDKIARLHKLMQEGRDMNAIIQQKKSFRNPSIYEKLIAYCEIDEFGSNFPTEVYDPHCWKDTDYYEHLAKRQKEEMDRRERERKERTKIEFISGTAKKSVPSSSSSVGIASNSANIVSQSNSNAIGADKPNRKKSKWDVPASGASSGNVGTLINPDVIRQKVEKAAATIQSFYK